MDAYQFFEKSFVQDHCMTLNNVQLIIRKEDGYLNAGSLCRAGNKLFTGWQRNQRSQAFLKEVETRIDKPLIETSKSENRHGTYVHPIIAINIAQWISPQFDVDVTKWIFELFLTGTVVLSENKTLSELDKIYQEKVELEKKYTKLGESYEQLSQDHKKLQTDHQSLVRNHEKIKTRKTEYKFQDGNCFYLVRNITETDTKYKFGITNNMTQRLRTYRTISPLLYIHRVVYIEEHTTLEQYVKIAFKTQENPINNHEFIMNVPLEYINEKVDHLLKLFDNVNEIPQDVLKQINVQILSGMYDLENEPQQSITTSAKVKELELQMSEVSERCQELEQKQHRIVKQLETSMATQQIISPGPKQVQLMEQSEVEQSEVEQSEAEQSIIGHNVDHPTPIEHRFRYKDFQTILKIAHEHFASNNHNRFMFEFCVHMAYYSGIKIGELITMSKQDMLDYTDGKSIQINGRELFTSASIVSKFGMFNDNRHMIKGMVTSGNRSLTIRRLQKWCTPIFDKLEILNFGNLRQPGRYVFRDFQQTFLDNCLTSHLAPKIKSTHCQIREHTTLRNVDELPEFQSDVPVEHRYRRQDFETMINYIVESKEIHTHQQFMTRFIMYMGYYTGICARDLLTMTEQDMVDYIDGKQIKIGKYEIFTNKYIASQFNVFKDLKHLIKLGGMVNVRGERITPRRFYKWVAPIFDKLELVNFGQNCNPGKYTYQDLRSTFIISLFHSSIQRYEMHRYLSHVVVANWKKELRQD